MIKLSPPNPLFQFQMAKKSKYGWLGLFAFCYNTILKYIEPPMKFSYHKILIMNLTSPLGLMILHNKHRGYGDTRQMMPFVNDKTNLKRGSCTRTTDSFLQQANGAIKEALLDQRDLIGDITNIQWMRSVLIPVQTNH